MIFQPYSQLVISQLYYMHVCEFANFKIFRVNIYQVIFQTFDLQVVASSQLFWQLCDQIFIVNSCQCAVYSAFMSYCCYHDSCDPITHWSRYTQVSSGKIFNMAPNNAGIPWPERKWLFLLGHLKFTDVPGKAMQMQMSSVASRYIKIRSKKQRFWFPAICGSYSWIHRILCTKELCEYLPVTMYSAYA